MRRFFVKPEDVDGERVRLVGSEARHLIKVLRVETGEQVQLFDGSGMIYTAIIERLARDRVEAVIVARLQEECDPVAGLHLAQGLPKGKKMDFIVQKATELGVLSIRPFSSAFSVVRKQGDERQVRRTGRWQRIALEACKQCGRPTPPACLPMGDFSEIIEGTAGGRSFTHKLIFWEGEAVESLARIFSSPPGAGSSILALIGPEGGFSPAEVDLAMAAGCQPVSLGRRILRTETASLAALAILQYLLGNLGRA